mmetsp:Transcript_10181/g.23216  ORF Transcript_10181/g.23216 Transcript_10181/m.23216 type:complete len:213 (-) Transcript_10181:106-744(-)
MVAALLEAAGLVPDRTVPRCLREQELEDTPGGLRLSGPRLEQCALEQRAPRLVDWDALQRSEQRARSRQVVHPLEVLDCLEHERLVVRAVLEPSGQDATAALEVPPLLLHLGVLEPSLGRRRLQLGRQPVKPPRLVEVLLAFCEVGHLEVHPPVHRIGQVIHALLRELLRMPHALALRLLAAKLVGEGFVHRARLRAHRQLLALPRPTVAWA